MDGNLPLPQFNRSEAPTSVALAMLLAEPSLGGPLLRKLAAAHSWTMSQWIGPGDCHEALTIPEADIEASALVFPARDFAEGLPEPETSIGAWRGEIDVVAMVPGHVAIGIELKVLSATGGLAEQMKGQIGGLRLLAKKYDCPYVAQVALTPALPYDLPSSVNRLTFAKLGQALAELGAATVSERDILAVVARQVEHVLRITERPSDQGYVYVPLNELLDMGRDPAHASKWVGVQEGLARLNAISRLRWKVAEQRLGGNWYPLPGVARRVTARLAGEPALDRGVITQSYRTVTLNELRRMASDPANECKWVGAKEGIEALRINTRSAWKVANIRANGNWHPLRKVVARIEEILQANSRR